MFSQDQQEGFRGLRLRRMIFRMQLATTTASSFVRLATVLAEVTRDAHSAAVYPELSDLGGVIWGDRHTHDSNSIELADIWPSLDMKFNVRLDTIGKVLVFSVVNETGQGLEVTISYALFFQHL